jgi:hypothetical protein
MNAKHINIDATLMLGNRTWDCVRVYVRACVCKMSQNRVTKTPRTRRL